MGSSAMLCKSSSIRLGYSGYIMRSPNDSSRSLPLGKRRDHFLAFAVPEKVRELKESDPEIFQPADYGNEWSPLMNYLPSAAWTWLVCTRKTPKVFAFNDM